MTQDDSKCPENVSEERIAALCDRESGPAEDPDAFAHMQECEVCATLYFEHLAAMDLAIEASTPRRARKFGWPGRFPLAAAAVLVLLLSGIAIGSLLPFVRTVFVGQTNWTGASDPSLWNLDLPALGVSPTAKLLEKQSFQTPDGAPGTILAVSGNDGEGVNFCAFDENGRALWSSERTWEDDAQTAGAKDVTLREFRRVYTARTSTGLEESFVAVLHRSLVSAILVIDPATGHRRRQLFCRASVDSALEVLPEDPDGQRPLLVGGFSSSGRAARPFVLVLDGANQVRQSLWIPYLSRGHTIEAGVTGILVNFRTDPAHVKLEVAGEIIVTMGASKGSLDPGSAQVIPTDNMIANLEYRLNAEVVESMMLRFGGPDQWRETLAGEIKVASGLELDGWDR
jgi:hypothetical protein